MGETTAALTSTDTSTKSEAVAVENGRVPFESSSLMHSDPECNDNNGESDLMRPLVSRSVPTSPRSSPRARLNSTDSDPQSSSPAPQSSIFRSRKQPKKGGPSTPHRNKRRKQRTRDTSNTTTNSMVAWKLKDLPCCPCCTKDYQREVVRSTLSIMNILARLLFWSSLVFTAGCVVWYSHELKNNGTDPHLIAWFSAGAFVLLGFPISMYGIVMHLANYNQPNVQCYIVRILWMVPIYSLESWLCLRFHRYAIYIETLRDCYEAYVLYNFLQFLIQVLGGEEELILMLKDKSPTRGAHMWGLQWCVRPWLMGQPVSRTVYNKTSEKGMSSSSSRPPMKRVHWTSPFFKKCKFGVLQYVLLKVVSSIFVMILELHGLYKEGDFTPRGGYLYICILTNLSQCWALYCLIFFYFATKNELGPIRPVGKFLSVKALVFFTWWQSVGISMMYQMDMIPRYSDKDNAENEWTSEDVAKGLQDYLICIEMFVAAIVHVFVFPHTDYLAAAVAARNKAAQRRQNALLLKSDGGGGSSHHASYHKRLGRKGRTGPWNSSYLYSSSHHHHRDDRSMCSKNSFVTSEYDLELGATHTASACSSDNMTNDEMPLFPDLNNNNRLLVSTELDQHDNNEDLIVMSPLNEGDDDDLVVADGIRTEMGRLSAQQQEEERAVADAVVGRAADEDDGSAVLVDGSMETDDGDLSRDTTDEYDDDDDEEEVQFSSPEEAKTKNPGFVRALLDSTIPRDVMDSTVGIVKGDYRVEKKTLLHHAATSDQYDLFSSSRARRAAFNNNKSSDQRHAKTATTTTDDAARKNIMGGKSEKEQQ